MLLPAALDLRRRFLLRLSGARETIGGYEHIKYDKMHDMHEML
jgi:hypothetical protein